MIFEVLPFLVTIIVASAFLHSAAAHPSGAPITVCSNFKPNHGVTSPQSSTSPYELDLSQFAVASSFVYIPGQQYNITLKSSSDSVRFKGFAIQARSVSNATIRGSFSNLPNHTKYINCSVAYPMATVTHDNTDRNDYVSLTLTWTAPLDDNGPLRFQIMVVQTYNIFWSEISSDIIQEHHKGYLSLANTVDIKTMDFNGSYLKTSISNPINVLDTNFHYRNNYLFWPDYTFTPYIKRSSLNGDNVITIIKNNLITPSSVAVDWTSNKIYWSDENTSRIEVADLSGSNRMVLLDVDMLHPRDLVIDSITKHLYWTDWGLDRIEVASLDGSSRQVIHNTSLKSPVALTIDYQAQVLYWIDSTIEKLEKSSVDGSNRQTLLNAQNILNNAGEMSFFSNKLYWAERKGKCVYSTDINDPQNYQVLLSGLTYQLYSVEAVHPLRQPKATNPCEVNNGDCEQLCLLSASSSSGYSCACADGFLSTTENNTQCIAASIYKVKFCLSGMTDCNSWTDDQLQNAKMFEIARAIVAGVRSLCTGCTNTFTSGNLLSSEFSTLTCTIHNSSLVQFYGYVYGYSLTDDTPLLSAIDQWIATTPLISIFRDKFQVVSESQCSDLTSASDGISANYIGIGNVIADAIVFVCAALVVTYCCYICCKACAKQHKSQASVTTLQNVQLQNYSVQPLENGNAYQGKKGENYDQKTDTVDDPVNQNVFQVKIGFAQAENGIAVKQQVMEMK